MQSHGPKRVYTPQSLEFWFEKLDSEWENHFLPTQLEEGRRIYRDGEVRELELTDHDAIVHRRVDKRDEYAVLEWDAAEGTLAVRSSSTDPDMARALAVAGIHEIEELVADEIPVLPGEPVVNGNGQAAKAGTAKNGTHGTNGTNGNQGTAANGTGTPKPPAGEVRPLLLVFKVRAAGLLFQAYWLEPNGRSRQPALGSAAHANGQAHVTSAERAKLINLAAYARRAHFHYHQENGQYLLESLVEIPNFLKTVLPAWRRHFVIELDGRAGHPRRPRHARGGG
jgi:hypothetical protein